MQRAVFGRHGLVVAAAAPVVLLIWVGICQSQVVFDNPESAVFDAARDRYLISNVGSGAIVEIAADGTLSYFSTALSRTLGMVIVDDTLYVTDASGVVGFDLGTGQRVATIPIPGSQVLNDIAADAAGNLYVTDSARGRVYRVRISDQSSTTLASGIYWPNGIHHDGRRNRVLFCSFGSNAPIRAIDLTDLSLATVIETGLTDLDGLTEDNSGNIYVSSWGSGAVYRYDHDFSSPPEEVSTGHQGPADIYFNTLDHVLVVPNFEADTVSFVPLIADQFSPVLEGEVVNDGGGSWGVSWVDYDSDGFLDLFVANVVSPNRLYRNRGDGTFSKITDDIIATDPSGWGGGATWGDYDNDGDEDAFVANWENARNLLYRNDGDGSFTKIEHGPVVNDPGWSISPGWIDFDNDGDLDLYVANHDTEPRTGVGRNYLYENTRSGFVKIDDAAIVAESSHSNHASWADFDHDGDLDLLVVNAWGDDRSNRLYRNDGGGDFTEVVDSEVAADDSDSWGASWGDYDNDGDLDLFVSATPANLLYENDGEGNLSRVQGQVISEEGEGSSGSAWGDFDNDGDLDLFVAVGSWNAPRPNLLYENDGSGTFARVSEGPIVTDLASSNGAAWGDYDRDGDLDLFVTNALNLDEDNALYRNNGTRNAWIEIRLVGTRSNRSAIGARVWATAAIGGEPVRQLREVSAQTGKNGQSSLDVHFGLGDAERIEVLQVEWPSGLVETLREVAVNRFLTVREGEADTRPPPRRVRGRPDSAPPVP